MKVNLSYLRLEKFVKTGVVFDANVLLLYVIGSINTNLISTYKRTASFNIDEFIFLNQIQSYFGSIYTTPNSLTEVSNLLESKYVNSKSKYLEELSKHIPQLNEVYTCSNEACKDDHFSIFGLSDSTLISMAKRGFYIVTADGPLYFRICKQGYGAFNINHLLSYT